MWAKVQKSRPKFSAVTLRVTLKVIDPARWIRLSKCWILSIISIFDLQVTFKVTSGWTGSRIFRLAVVDIPIQYVTSITLGHQIRALPSRAGVVYSKNTKKKSKKWGWLTIWPKYDLKKKCMSDCHKIAQAVSELQVLSNKKFMANSVEQISGSWGVGQFKGEVWCTATLKVGGTIFFDFYSMPWG